MGTKIDKGQLIYSSVIVIIFIICIVISWNIVDADKNDVIQVFENQIIAANNNDMAELLDNTYINYTAKQQAEDSEITDESQVNEQMDNQLPDEEQAFAGENHAIIKTSANLSVVNLEVRYNEAGEIVILDYSNAEVGPKIIAIVIAIVVAIILSLIWTLIFEELEYYI